MFINQTHKSVPLRHASRDTVSGGKCNDCSLVARKMSPSQISNDPIFDHDGMPFTRGRLNFEFT